MKNKYAAPDDETEDSVLLPSTTEDQANATWSEIPYLALATGRGRVLSDEVLLQLFIECITSEDEHIPLLTNMLLVRFGSLASVFASDTRALRGVLHIGPHLIPAVSLVHEAALRYCRARMGRNDILSNPTLMLEYLTSRMAREPVEQFRILFLDEKNRLLADEAQTQGTVNHTPVYPREVARHAMELDASSIVLAHNHPSGDPTPSDADIIMTKEVQRAVALIDVTIADHIIIGNGAHVSMRESGLLLDLPGW